MFFTKVRPEIEKIYKDYSLAIVNLFDFIDFLDDEPTLQELYQKMEDFKNFGPTEEYMKMYNEVAYDVLFIASLEAAQKRMDLSAIKVMMTFCNDEMHNITPLRDHWIDAFNCGPEPDVFREMFTHLHKGLPHGREMLAEYFYWYLIPRTETALLKGALYARKDAFWEVWDKLGSMLEKDAGDGETLLPEKKQADYDKRIKVYTAVKNHYLANGPTKQNFFLKIPKDPTETPSPSLSRQALNENSKEESATLEEQMLGTHKDLRDRIKSFHRADFTSNGPAFFMLNRRCINGEDFKNMVQEKSMDYEMLMGDINWTYLDHNTEAMLMPKAEHLLFCSKLRKSHYDSTASHNLDLPQDEGSPIVSFHQNVPAQKTATEESSRFLSFPKKVYSFLFNRIKKIFH